MTGSSNNSCGGMMMEKGRDDEMRTVECLRGRLLAERAASKAARDEAELLDKRMTELEEQVAQEIKQRDRAEERLRHALKKLGSTSSTQCGSMGELEEEHGSGGNEGIGCGSSDHLVPRQGCWRSVSTIPSNNKEEPHQERNFQKVFTYGQSSPGPNDRDSDDDRFEYKGDSLALVPASIWPSSENLRPESRRHVQEVLRSLRHVKEKLHSSLERRVASFPPKELYGQ